MNRILIALTIALIALVGCNKGDDKNSCPLTVTECMEIKPYLVLHWSFRQSDIDMFIVKAYKYDDSYRTLLNTDTVRYIDDGTGDANHHFPDLKFSDSLDFSLEFPNIGKTIYIHSAPVPVQFDTTDCEHRRAANDVCGVSAPYYTVNEDTVRLQSDGPLSRLLLVVNH